MLALEQLRLEVRIPISPTPGFFSQVRLFDYALRRLPAPYSAALLAIYVGDNCDIAAVRSANTWAGPRVVWRRVPSDVFDTFGIYGTADWRLCDPLQNADVLVLADADTVLLRDINPLLASLQLDRPVIRGHMAHAPPAASLSSPDAPHYWPQLFESFGISWPKRLHPYSMDASLSLPSVPAYFNLGFVALTPPAALAIGRKLLPFQIRLKAVEDSPMRCQIALTLLAYTLELDIDVLPAAYNAANDLLHMKMNALAPEDIRVLHYLRGDEVDRNRFVGDEHIAAFLESPLANPANCRLQDLVREFAESRVRHGE